MKQKLTLSALGNKQPLVITAKQLSGNGNGCKNGWHDKDDGDNHEWFFTVLPPFFLDALQAREPVRLRGRLPMPGTASAYTGVLGYLLRSRPDHC